SYFTVINDRKSGVSRLFSSGDHRAVTSERRRSSHRSCSERKAKMAELEDVTLDGKPLHSLRVADLKSALEERGLSKSGQKNALIKRLKGIGEEMSQNSFIKQYLAKQQELLRQRLEREAREAAEADDSTAAPDDEDHAEGSDITSCAPDPQCSVPPHPLPPPPGGTKEMMSAESCVAEPGPQEAPQPPRAVASLSVRVLPPPGPARSSLPLSQSAHDEDGEEEQGAALRRSGRGQPTWERSRRKQQPPQHIPPRQPTPPPSPPLEPEPSFLLPDTPKQSPPVPASAPPMQAGGPAPLPGSPPEPEGGVEQGPPMPATLQEQPQTSTQPTESVPDTSPSALAPTPQVPPPKGGSAPCAATERAAAGAERVTLQGRGACVVPVLPPSPPPEDGDPNRAGARLSSSSPSSPSSLSSSTQEKLRPAHQGNAGLSPPYRRTGVVLEEGAASQKKGGDGGGGASRGCCEVLGEGGHASSIAPNGICALPPLLHALLQLCCLYTLSPPPQNVRGCLCRRQQLIGHNLYGGRRRGLSSTIMCVLPVWKQQEQCPAGAGLNPAFHCSHVTLASLHALLD
ncbi:hypothetical protein JZ751_016888, partial [Albula glossodonta]